MATRVSPISVLIVDDDDDCRRIYRLALEHAGHTVFTAINGAEGVRLAKSHEPSVILMDIAMPVLDGLAAFREIRSHASTCDIPVIAITARASSDEVEGFLTAGFDDLLLKPVKPTDVVAAVDRRQIT